MPAHDIIDNRQEKLVDHINRILDSSDAVRFAVGYFFLYDLHWNPVRLIHRFEDHVIPKIICSEGLA